MLPKGYLQIDDESYLESFVSLLKTSAFERLIFFTQNKVLKKYHTVQE